MTTRDCNKKVLDLWTEIMGEYPGRYFTDIFSSFFIPEDTGTDFSSMESENMYLYASNKFKPQDRRRKRKVMSMADRDIHEANYLCATVLRCLIDRYPDRNIGWLVKSFFIPDTDIVNISELDSLDIWRYACHKLDDLDKKPHIKDRTPAYSIQVADKESILGCLDEWNGTYAVMIKVGDKELRLSDLHSRSVDIQFPGNPNTYRVNRLSKNPTKRNAKVSEFIAREYSHLCWSDKVARPTRLCEEIKDTPLDSACKELSILMGKRRKSRELKEAVLEHYADAMYIELSELSEFLNLKFTSLSIYQFKTHRIIANYSMYNGHINFNSSFLSCNPMAVRETLVHELCHDNLGEHGSNFVKRMEESLIRIGMLQRSCVYAPEYLSGHSPLFPIDSCQYDMHHVFKGLRAERGEVKSDHVSWKGKAYERIMRMSRILLHDN